MVGELKVTATVKELMDAGVWDEVCDLLGLNPWAVNEGLMDSSESLTFTPTQSLFERLGLGRNLNG